MPKNDIDWSNWILQKNNEAQQESLKKSELLELNDLEKGAAPKIETGSVFTMDHVNHVASMKDHQAAKSFAHDVLSNSTANPKNRTNIGTMIDKSRSAAHLAQGMSNHILAHPKEGLKVIKDDRSRC